MRAFVALSTALVILLVTTISPVYAQALPITLLLMKHGNNWYGSGNAGALTVTSGTTSLSTTTGQTYLVKQYSSINVSSGATLTITNACQGLILYCSGNFNNAGTIKLDGLGYTGFVSANQYISFYQVSSGKKTGQNTYLLQNTAATGGGGAASNTTQSHAGAAGSAGSAGSAGQCGGGGGGGSGGNGNGSGHPGGAGGSGSSGDSNGGGSGGGGGGGQGNNTAGSASGMTGGNGSSSSTGVIGAGGGGAGNPAGSPGATGTTGTAAQTGIGSTLCIFVGGTFTNSGTISCKGMPGGFGGNQSSGEGGGGGGGSGGGNIIILSGGSISNIGTVSCAGGAGGTGGTGSFAGGNGGAGGAGSVQGPIQIAAFHVVPDMYGTAKLKMCQKAKHDYTDVQFIRIEKVAA